MKPFAILTLLLAAAALAGGQSIPAVEADGSVDSANVIVREGGVFEVDELVVTSGTGLVLRGVDVRVGTSVLVEEGASLRLEPLGDTPTRVGPQNATTGFWILVRGHIESEGTPRTDVWGVNGDTLDSAQNMMPGAFQVNGTAVLKDLLFRNSTAGFLVMPSGHLVLERARLDGLEFMAVAALGKVEVAESHFANTSISISGRVTCDVTVRDSIFESWGGHFQMNRCPLTASRIRGEGGSTGAVFLGRGPYRLEDVHMRGFLGSGLRGDGSAHIWVANSTFVAGPGARNVISLKPDHEITLLNVTAVGSDRHAVEIQSSKVHVQGGRYVGSGGYGIQLVASEWTAPLDAVGDIDFGIGTPEANALGAVNIRRIVYAQAVNEEGLPVKGLEVQVVDRSTGETVYQTTGPSGGGSVVMDLPVLRVQDGVLVPGGPFDYVASHAAAKTQRGTLEDDQRLLQIQLEEAPQGRSMAGALRVTILLAAAGVLLLVYALFDKPIKKWLRGRKGNGDNGGGA